MFDLTIEALAPIALLIINVIAVFVVSKIFVNIIVKVMK
jgi:hypothetical protein